LLIGEHWLCGTLQFDVDLAAAPALGMRYQDRWELEDEAAEAAGMRREGVSCCGTFDDICLFWYHPNF
jgi:hypothetical protein